MIYMYTVTYEKIFNMISTDNITAQAQEIMRMRK